MAERISNPKIDVKRTGTEPAIRIEATAAGTGPDIVVDGSITATGGITGAITGDVTATTVTVTDIALGNDLTIADAGNVIVNATTGTKIGTATTQKLGFYNATPVVQQTVVSVPAAITGGESPTETEHNDLRTAVAAIVTRLQNLGLFASS